MYEIYLCNMTVDNLLIKLMSKIVLETEETQAKRSELVKHLGESKNKYR